MKQKSCLEHVGACLEKVDGNPEIAALAFTRVDREGALRQARALDADSVAGGRLTGTVCSVKACYDVEGWVTHAGSKALANAAPARRDAAAVARLRAHGAIVLAQTNMTEFAYGALGVNCRFGTPLTPLFRNERRVAGGSSSGAAVSVAMGFADFALCSDTSGSARIPAAFCGVAGYIPARGSIPTSGMIGLSPSFDVPGVMAASVAGCRRAALALTEAPPPDASVGRPDFSLLVPDEVDALADPEIAAAFRAAARHLASKGVRVVTRPLPFLFDAGRIAAEGGMIAADAYSLHETCLRDRGGDYDPLVRSRIEAGARVPAYEYVRALRSLDALSDRYEDELEVFDAVLTPTCPMFPPLLDDLSDEEVYLRTNKRSFVYTEIANRLNKPSISLPLGPRAAGPAGMLLTGRRRGEDALLELAARIEALLNESP